MAKEREAVVEVKIGSSQEVREVVKAYKLSKELKEMLEERQAFNFYWLFHLMAEDL